LFFRGTTHLRLCLNLNNLSIEFDFCSRSVSYAIYFSSFVSGATLALDILWKYMHKSIVAMKYHLLKIAYS